MIRGVAIPGYTSLIVTIFFSTSLILVCLGVIGQYLSKIQASLNNKPTYTIKESHLDDFSSMESAGTWSPNSKQFAFVAVKKGQNILVIKNVEN